MPSLGPVSRRDLVRKLKILGFNGPYPDGKHQWMQRRRHRVDRPASPDRGLAQHRPEAACTSI